MIVGDRRDKVGIVNTRVAMNEVLAPPPAAPETSSPVSAPARPAWQTASSTASPHVTPGPTETGSHPATELDGRLHAAEGRLSGGLSMAALGLAFLDWGVHLANAPFRRVALAKQAANQWGRLAAAATGAPAIAPLPTDHRFRGPGWQQPPFNLISQAFLLAEEWWAEAAAAAPGVDRANQRIVSFGYARSSICSRRRTSHGSIRT